MGLTGKRAARARIFAGCLITIMTALPLAAQENGGPKLGAPAERTHAPAASEFLVLPLRVYRLKSAEVAEIDCRQLTDDDIRRIVARANVIWASAGIHWQLESIDDLPAENTGRLKLATRIGKADSEDAGKDAAKTPRVPHTAFRGVIPEASRARPEAYRVLYVHDFDVNGVYFGNREAMVKETAALRPVEGGVEEPLPRVTSHELGHALGLPHRQDRLNLMASGTTGTSFVDDEMRKAREIARANPACVTFDDLARQAAETNDQSRRILLECSVRSIHALAGQRIYPVSNFDWKTLMRANAPASAAP